METKARTDRNLELRSALAKLGELGEMDATQTSSLIEQAVVEVYYRLIDPELEAGVSLDADNAILKLTYSDNQTKTVALDDLGTTFARKAWSAARAAVIRRLRQLESERLIQAFGNRSGQLSDSIVERFDGKNWWVAVDGFPAILPLEEQIPQEQVTRNQHLKVLILHVQRRTNGEAILVVSRSHPQLPGQLLTQEVPEIARGQVIIKGIIREAGRKTKVLVDSPDMAIDAQGACIGPKGVRHRAVVGELGDEQVQVIAWTDDVPLLIERCLAPAKISQVMVDLPNGTAKVTVDPSQLSLAIGAGGENVRLAAKLVGLRIDIVPDDAILGTDAEVKEVTKPEGLV